MKMGQKIYTNTHRTAALIYLIVIVDICNGFILTTQA